ncbi:hypothetical protein LTR08_005385 [Meristemomyces frigidus]|nr:hypothetical protein LTR08_005385 [Meristemomyces frigidus]
MFWVDAVSINQNDIPEKNTQIQKLAMIYNRATNVSVWLGGEDSDSGRAIEFIERLLRLEDFDPLTKDPGTPAEWAALHNLMQRPWFSRRWIVQEISLARSATLFCGSQSVTWQDFSIAISLFVARYRDLRALFQSSKDFHNHPNYLGEVEALGAKALVNVTTKLFRKSDDGVVLERLLSLEALISTLTLFESASPHGVIYSGKMAMHELKNYYASGKTKMYPEKGFIQGRTLVVTGFPLDAIRVKRNPAYEGIIPSGWLDLLDWKGPPERVPDRVWRTLVADRGPGGLLEPPAHWVLACKWVFEQRVRRGHINTNELITSGKCPSIATEFLRRVQAVMWDRMLVLTQGSRRSKKLLALVPPEAEEGDFIVILYGCSVPVVLRRHRKRKAEADTLYSQSTRTESSFSSSDERMTKPEIALSRATSDATGSDAEITQPSTPASRLFVGSKDVDTAYVSTGVWRPSNTGQSEQELHRLPISLDSRHQYTFIGEAYVHGMMAGEGFKHQKDNGNKLRAFQMV